MFLYFILIDFANAHVSMHAQTHSLFKSERKQMVFLGTVLYRSKVAGMTRYLDDNGSGDDDDEYINRAHDPYIQCVHIFVCTHL